MWSTSLREDHRSTKQSIKVTKNGLLRRFTPPRNDASYFPATFKLLRLPIKPLPLLTFNSCNLDTAPKQRWHRL
ncbi:hypothetical protein [Candidatus Tisiphia endosymbiont of Hybos culiciformis]|uniref:hypothetical protein n=1 Tax=Candidatus Tisiphia endosymbiont of Hybos culiciformis TaxID=3139331 RepID=UPI003CCA9A48